MTEPLHHTAMTAASSSPGPFQAGDRVRVRNVDPPGHRRTPAYIRGKTGVVERDCGAFLNPEERAYGFSGRPRRQLYRIRFRQADVWPAYAGTDRDVLDVEIYDHWLEPHDERREAAS